ncbi:YSIRK-type signal peptide-containing protein [Lactobacillus sp. PV034]|uniref:YSIRK-type signal peptide-containing protein n=1 Tax=Lactobacillus sp. PV034 TaxID=2594495 RepID=UPI0022400EBC|nr:YSIRK-type signal peptide-containing protein [Lactobacillus sp. PV034]QNQ81531.1 YSIRK-type signal peptide-containing protein [Lactobacillus sp. PV034]
MLSKNNKQEKNRRLEEKNSRFSIRKFTVGTASVLIGAFFMGVSGTQTVHAADDKAETTTVNVNTLEQAPKDNVNNPLVANVDLGDDLGLGDLLNNYNKQFGDKNQTTTNKDAQQPAASTTSDNKPAQTQQTDLDKATDKLVKDAVANLNKDPKADAPKVEVKKTNRTVLRSADVYEPGVDPNDDFLDKGYYYGDLNMDDMPQTRVTIDGKEYPTLWGSKSYDAMSLTDALKGNNWTLADDGTWNHTLPAEPGYTAKIARVSVDVLGGPDGIFTQEQRDEAKKLTDQLNDDIAKNPYEIPAYTISSPLAVTFHVGYDKSVKVETREKLNVTLPTATDPDNEYYYIAINTDQNDMAGSKSEDGSYTWQPVEHAAMSLDEALSKSDFTYADDGTGHHSLPVIPGYRAKITSITGPDIADGSLTDDDETNEALYEELQGKIDANPYEIPAYTTTLPYDVSFNVEYEKIPTTPVKVETRERLDVTLPTSTDPDEDYYYGGINTDANDMSGEKSEDGTYTWKPVEHAALDLNDALSKPDFVYAENGSWHNTLPSIPGYRAYISGLTANSASPMDNDNEAEVDALMDELFDKIDANPYEIPAYTTTTPINIYFYVDYEKVSDVGEVVTTPALPEYQGDVTGIPETRPADKPFEGGVAGMPLTQEALPEAQVGIVGEPLTEEALPEAQVGIAGEPLTEEALPEAQVGIVGEPLTEEALPEAQVGIAGEPLTEEALPEARVGVAGEPLTQEALPEAQVGIAGEPLTQEALPEAQVGIVGEPLTEEALPEAQVGIAGEPLTEEALPEAQVGIAGEPLTQEALPEAQVGIAGTPLTEEALPEAQVGIAGTPLVEEALPAYTGDLSTSGDAVTTPVLPEANLDDQSSASDNEPVVMPEETADAAATVAPHATDTAETEVVDNNVVEEDTTAPVHSNVVSENEDQLVAQGDNTVAPKTEANVDTKQEAKRENTLPQTGAKATAAGVLGLMMVGVAAVLGLAVDKKRKN